MQFKISTELIDHIKSLVVYKNDTELELVLSDFHYADIAEILEELNLEEAIYIIKLLDTETTADVLMELNEEDREKVLNKLSPKEIADELEEMDTDDAADILAEFTLEEQEEIIANIEDEEHKADIQELLGYEEDTAGGLMAKELIKVRETWTVAGCLREMRRQANYVTRVHSIYVVDKDDKLIGRFSLKNLLTVDPKTKISEISIPRVDHVSVNTPAEEVAKIMQKYDLEAIPVVDEINRLVGRITIDDIVDFIKDEAEKDYQLAAGISNDVEADDSILKLSKARLPWLVLGLFGGLGSVYIMQGFEGALEHYPILFFFTPLIAAMAGNVGVQSSAIIVQGLANDLVKGNIVNRLAKELALSLFNGTVLALLVFGFGFLVGQDLHSSMAIAISLLMVIIIAALVGTFVPLFLDKRGIDPAIATGPFITTSNDILGIFLFFYISKLILGF
jgi:magnesium transporter